LYIKFDRILPVMCAGEVSMKLHELQVSDIVKYNGPFEIYTDREFIVVNPCGCNGDISRVEVIDKKTSSTHGLVREHLELVRGSTCK